MPINYALYPPNWKSEIVPSVLKRAGDCCEECGSPNYSMQWRGKKEIRNEKNRKVTRVYHYPSMQAAIDDGAGKCIDAWNKETGTFEPTWRGIYQTKIILTVAHLDHDETNWQVSIERLKALCQLHHLQYDAAEKYRRSSTAGYYDQRKPKD